MNMTPCKDCVNRHLACHDTCEEYLVWKAERGEKKMMREEALKKSRERPIWTHTMRKKRLCDKGKW